MTCCTEAPLLEKSLISVHHLNRDDITTILEYSQWLKDNPQPDLLKGCIMASCFFEPSTRTRLSFESAMYRLGGQVIGFSDAQTTSATKQEALADTIKVVGEYADVLVIRHPLEGSAQLAAESTTKPVINGGDGTNQHPTQTLLDLFSIKESQGRLDNLHIAMVGDLKHGRTTHSLAQACAHFNARLYFVSPPSLEIPQHICEDLRHKRIKFSFHRNLEDVLGKADILYMTRIQEERFADSIEYHRLKNAYELKRSHLLDTVKDNMRILHPLPRVNEISRCVDGSPHAYYFQQAQNGLYIRQALLALALGKGGI
ncbi:Aspartate carbamoyltransferase [Chlamydiales bacterium SCGC AG-110-M15]|nr:Aspartate carbamoyltransferase [Chlamydiales bacterium SCGC AG-110-M15]